MLRCILDEVESGHYLISIRLYFILTILIHTEDGLQPSFLNDCHINSVVSGTSSSLFSTTYDQMKSKNKRSHTVGTVVKCNRKS